MTDETTTDAQASAAVTPASEPTPEPAPVPEPVADPAPTLEPAPEQSAPADHPVDAADTLQSHGEGLLAEGNQETGNALLLISGKLLEVRRLLEEFAKDLEGDAEAIVAHLRAIL